MSKGTIGSSRLRLYGDARRRPPESNKLGNAAMVSETPRVQDTSVVSGLIFLEMNYPELGRGIEGRCSERKPRG